MKESDSYKNYLNENSPQTVLWQDICKQFVKNKCLENILSMNSVGLWYEKVNYDTYYLNSMFNTIQEVIQIGVTLPNTI